MPIRITRDFLFYVNGFAHVFNAANRRFSTGVFVKAVL